MTANDLPIATIILAAGKGTRMGSPDRQKVCLPVAGTPAILRAMRTYASIGASPQVVVVGYGAEQVKALVGREFGDAIFAYQTEQRGTGHATKIGIQALKEAHYDGNILVVAGDKIVDRTILLRLVKDFVEKQSDLSFLVGNSRDFPDSGRVIVSSEGRPQAIVEIFDLQRWKLVKMLWKETERAPVAAPVAETLARQLFSKEQKMILALGSLWPLIERGDPIHHSDVQSLCDTPKRAVLEACSLQSDCLANLSVYVFRAPVLYEVLETLPSDNAQNEEYLTDVVGIMPARGRHIVHFVQVEDPKQVLSFNSQAELRAINDYYALKESKPRQNARPSALHRPTRWLEILESDGFLSYFAKLYNGNKSMASRKINRVKQLVARFRQEYGDTEALLVRAPGRVNLMGRHIDHQGGGCNLMAIDREIFIMAAERDDNVVKMSNLDRANFPEREFRTSDFAKADLQDWLIFVNSSAVRSIANNDWANYVKAAFLRLQAFFDPIRFKGFSMMASGDIPIAAGLSSSSALVVATAELLLGFNQLHLQDSQFVELCGEGEWYVGTRGGFADHAAIKMGRQGQVLHVSFHPIVLEGSVTFPDDHVIVLCDSHLKAYKSAGSRNTFNQRVACYQLGRMLFSQAFPRLASRIDLLRDISPQHLQIELADFYRMVKALPNNVTRSHLLAILPQEELAPIFASHADFAGTYPIRDVDLFGIAECERSRRSPDMLKEGFVSEFGRLMTISHNGDRVVSFDAAGNEVPYGSIYSDAYFDEMESMARSGDARAALRLQSGSYRCSVREIDLLVDLANSIPGVKGAQLSGAGLGGCAMVLVEEPGVEDLIRTLTDKFYSSSNMEPAIAVCAPVAGSGVIMF
jgi:N-acetylgalactosamine kinase